MAYDEGLLQRVREVADTGEEWVEKKMFGGGGGYAQWQYGLRYPRR